MEENINVDTIPQSDGTISENETVQQETTQQSTETTTQETTETPKYKVKVLEADQSGKYNRIEKELSVEELISHAQMGMDYSRVKGKYEESKPVIGFVERLAQQNGMTVPEYLKAVEEHERQQEIESLSQNNGLPQELAEELYLSRQERKQREVEKQHQQQQARQQQEYIDFLNEFPSVKPDEIPKEVWETKANNPSISLTDAYIRHEYNKMQQKFKAQEVNAENANASTGSVTGNGNTTNDFISYTTFEKNKNDRSWVMKNFDKITKSRSNW